MRQERLFLNEKKKIHGNWNCNQCSTFLSFSPALSVCLSLSVSACLSECLSLSTSVCLNVSLSSPLSAYMSVSLRICLHVHLSPPFCLHVYHSNFVCLSPLTHPSQLIRAAVPRGFGTPTRPLSLSFPKQEPRPCRQNRCTDMNMIVHIHTTQTHASAHMVALTCVFIRTL